MSFFLQLFPPAKNEHVLPYGPGTGAQGRIGPLQSVGQKCLRADAVTANSVDGARKEEAGRDAAAGWGGLDFHSSSLHITLGAAQGSKEACHPRYCLRLKPPSCAP